VPELDVQGWDRLSVGVSATGENAATRARASRKISWSVPAVWSYDPPGYQSIGWTDLSVTNLVTSSSKHGDDDAGDRHPVFLGDTEQGLQGVGGALAELPQETPVPQEVDAQHLRHREDILPMSTGARTSSATQAPNCSTRF